MRLMSRGVLETLLLSLVHTSCEHLVVCVKADKPRKYKLQLPFRDKMWSAESCLRALSRLKVAGLSKAEISHHPRDATPGY